MRAVKEVGIILALLLLSFVVPALQPHAQPPALQIEAVPESVKVPADGDVETLIIVRNPSDKQVENVQLLWFTDTGVQVHVQPAAPTSVGPYGTATWSVRVSESEQPRLPGKVFFRVSYTWTANEGTPAVPQVATVSLDVQEEKSALAMDVLGVEVRMASGALTEYRSGIASVVVTNKTDKPVTVTDVTPSGPDFLTYEPPTASDERAPGKTRALPYEMKPGETGAFPFKTTPGQNVQPGEHLLFFEIGYTWQERGQTYAGTALASTPITVGVLGESEILKVVGAPSFFLLPGFLLLITFGFLWTRVTPKTEFLELTSPEFWLFAVLLSLLSLPLYPWITGLFGASRNYLYGYGLLDLLYVWIGSIITGGIVYLILVGGTNVARRFRCWIQELVVRNRTPGIRDSPIDILRKLTRQGLTIERECAVVLMGDPQISVEAYLLQAYDASQDTIWIAPPMSIEWNGTSHAELYNKIQAALNLESSASKLADLLEKGHKENRLDVVWMPMGPLTRQCRVRSADVSSVQKAKVMVLQN